MGVWIETVIINTGIKYYVVTPFVGVWIETAKLLQLLGYGKSHPSWVCGLKLFLIGTTENAFQVTPFVGVWIETNRNRKHHCICQSHPSWVCGLKLIGTVIIVNAISHTLRGCVE